MKRHKCGGWERLILLEQEGELSPGQADRVKQHLESCVYCRRVAGEYRRLKRDLYAGVAIPNGAPAFTEPVFTGCRTATFRGIARWAGPVAACLLLLSAGVIRWQLFRPGDSPDEVLPSLMVNGTVVDDYYYVLLLERLPREEREQVLNLVVN